MTYQVKFRILNCFIDYWIFHTCKKASPHIYFNRITGLFIILRNSQLPLSSFGTFELLWLHFNFFVHSPRHINLMTLNVCSPSHTQIILYLRAFFLIIIYLKTPTTDRLMENWPLSTWSSVSRHSISPIQISYFLVFKAFKHPLFC